MENSSVSILCYTMDGNVLDKIGISSGSGYLTTIQAELKSEHSSLLHRAKDILKENYETEVENEKWKYLGEMHRTKGGKTIYCYAVETSEPIKGVEFFPVNKIVSITDSVCQANFLRLFSELYKKDILQQ